MFPESLKLAAADRRDSLKQLLKEAGNPDPDMVPLRPVGRCITDYDPFDDNGQEREPFVPHADPGDTTLWKSYLARLNAWAVQTVVLLRKYDDAIARHFEKLSDEASGDGNAQQRFCSLSREYYLPTLDGIVNDPMSTTKRPREPVDSAEQPGPQSVVQNFHGPVASVQSGAGGAANVVQNAHPVPAPIRGTEAEQGVTPADRPDWTNADQRLLRVELRLPTIYLGGGTCTVGICVWTVQELPPGIRIVESVLKVHLDGVPLSHVDVGREPIPLVPIGRSDLRTSVVKLDREYARREEIMMAGELFLTLDIPGEPKDVRVRLGSEQQLCRVNGR